MKSLTSYSTTLSYKSPDLLDLLHTILIGAEAIGKTRLDLTAKIIHIDTTTSELDIEVIASDVTLIKKYKDYLDSCEKESLIRTLFN